MIKTESAMRNVALLNWQLFHVCSFRVDFVFSVPNIDFDLNFVESSAN